MTKRPTFGNETMIRLTIFLFGTLALSGCMGETRPCPGFGTPLADMWSTGRNVGDIINYANKTGATIALELRSRVDSMPYEGSSHSGSEEITCFSNSVRQFEFENNGIVLRVKLNQTQFADPSFEDAQSFDINITPESLTGEMLAPGYVYPFSLGVQARQQYTEAFVVDNFTDNTGSQASRFIENLRVNSNEYRYAIERKFTDPAPITNAVINASPFATITRMILAEGAGLVEFELLNGEVYSRL